MNIPVINDDIVEEDETFSMSLSVPSALNPEVTTGIITSAAVTITDTTSEYCSYVCTYHHLIVLLIFFIAVGIRVRFVSNRYVGREDERFLLVILELSRGTSAYPFSVTVIPSERSQVSAEGKCVIIVWA